MDMSASPKPKAHLQLSWRSMQLNAASIASLRDEWEDLTEHASDPNVFATPTYIALSLPLIDNECSILSFYNDGLLIGLTILRDDIGYAKLPLLFKKSALHPEQYLSPLLVRKGCEDAFARCFCNWVEQTPPWVSFVNVTFARLSGDVADALAHHCRTHNQPFLQLGAFERAAIVPKRVSKDDFAAHLSANRRKSIRRAWNGLSKLGSLNFERLEQGGDLPAWLSGFLAMENAGWKGENNSSLLANSDEAQLYSEIVAEAFQAGDLHFTRLCLDDKPIGYTLDLWRGDHAFCLKSAFDEQYRKFSPGVLMEHEALKFYAEHDRIRLVDSCSAPTNDLLNELWPHQTSVADFFIGRRGWLYRLVFEAVKRIKRRSIWTGSHAQ